MSLKMKPSMFVTDASFCLPESDMSRDLPRVTAFEYTAPTRPFAGTLIASISSSNYPHDANREDRAAIPFPGMEMYRLAAAAATATKLRVIKIRGDGKCMFRAIALGLARNQGRFLGADAEQREADNLRIAVAEALCRTPKRRRQFGRAVIALESEDTLKNYCRRIQSPTFWGGEPEMIVLSEMLKVPIFVYLSDSEYGGSGGFTVIQKYGEKYRKKTKDAPARRPVRLLFTGGNHFDLLVK